MNNQFIKQENAITEQSVSTEKVIAVESVEEKVTKTKFTKKKIFIISGIVVIVIAIALVIFIPSKFERVKNECVHIAGMVSGDEDYFMIDTSPDSVPIPNAQERALEAIKYANEELGFNNSVYSRMIRTSALMGRQSEENDKYKVSWTYHPNDGLEVTYEKK